MSTNEQENIIIEPEELEEKINKTLEGTGLQVSIYETMDLYGVDGSDEENENDPYYGKPMYEAIMINAEGNTIDDTVTGRYCDVGTVANEIMCEAELFLSMKMGVIKDKENDSLKYMATGIVDKNDLFTGEVFESSGLAGFNVEYMYRGKYLPNIDIKGNEVEASQKKELFDLLVGDETFLPRCWEVSNTMIYLNTDREVNHYYAVRHPEQYNAEIPRFYQDQELTLPYIGEDVFLENTEGLVHDNNSLLNYQTMKRIVDNIRTSKSLDRTGLSNFLPSDRIEAIKDYMNKEAVSLFSNGYTQEDRDFLMGTVFNHTRSRYGDDKINPVELDTIEAIGRGEDIRYTQIASIMEDLVSHLLYEEEGMRATTNPSTLAKIEKSILILKRGWNDCTEAILAKNEKVQAQAKTNPPKI